MGAFRDGFLRGITVGFTSDGDPSVRAARWRARAVSYPLLVAGVVVLALHGPLVLGVVVLVLGISLMMYLRYQLGKRRALNRRKSA